MIKTAEIKWRSPWTPLLLVFVSAVGVIAWSSSATADGARTGCSSPAGPAACLRLPSAPYVTPEQAKQAMTALWNAREHANATRNVNALDGIDTGTELLEDHYALDSLICHCSTWYWTKGTRSVRDVTVFLPRQSNYPLFFAAEVLATPKGQPAPAGHVTAFLVVTRSAADQPWRIAMNLFDNGYSPPAVSTAPPILGAGAYDAPVPASSASEARKWPSMLAAYYQHIKDDGMPPASSQFLPGILTTGTDLALNRQGSVHDGIVSHYTFAAAPLGGPWVFDDHGSVEACADINEDQTESWAKPQTVFQQIDGIKPNWGPDLNTGFYSKIVTTWERAVCITPSQGRLQVWGAESTIGYPIHDGGVPATPGPGTTRVL